MATTTVTGVQEAIAKLREIGDEGERIASEEIVSGARRVQREARSDAPFLTGRLRNSIVVAETEEGVAQNSQMAASGGSAPNAIRPGMLSAWIGSSLPYARAQHWGTRHHSGVPFLFNAAEAERKRLLERLRASLKRLERT